MKKIIHINQHKIKSNSKNGSMEPVITCKTYKSNDYAHEVIINGPSKIVYRPDKPLSCGAKVWIETDSEIEIIEFNKKTLYEIFRNSDEDKDVCQEVISETGKT